MSAYLLSLLLSLTPMVPDGGTVVVKNQQFLAEVARTPTEQSRGLMYRQSLAKDRCMIFINDDDNYRTFWMKNTIISLDMVWVDSEGTVVEIAERAEPCPMPSKNYPDCPMYGGKVPSRNVVEFVAGTVRRLGLHVGDRIGWNIRMADGTVYKGGIPVPQNGSKKKHK